MKAVLFVLAVFLVLAAVLAFKTKTAPEIPPLVLPLSQNQLASSSGDLRQEQVSTSPSLVPITTVPSKNPSSDYRQIKVMKDVGEAYMDHFGLTDRDFQILKNAGINVIENNFDICATDEDINYLLQKSNQYGLKVIMPAGSGEAEWGYTCDQENFPANQKPAWQKKKVVAWVNKWKNNPAIYAWDISNEAGSVFPNSGDDKFGYFLTAQQLRQAYFDVKNTDSNHPVMIRINGWFFYDYKSNFFRAGNPFDKNMADIVMVNAYSNVEDYYPNFVGTVTNRAVSSLRSIDPKVKVIISLGAWEEKPLWFRPTAQHLKNEIAQLQERKDLSGIAYFKYGAKGSEWYLPDSIIGAPELLRVISEN